MKSLHPLTALMLCSALLWSSCRTEKALWIEVNEHGSRKTIAVTEGIARRFLDALQTRVRFTSKAKSELLTREMVRDVLDGRTRSATARDEQGTDVTIFMKPLRIPGDSRGNNRLVLDIYTSGQRTFHLALPELDIELADKERQISLRADIDWKSWIPFLAKAGGAVYIKDYDEGTEVWLYVE